MSQGVAQLLDHGGVELSVFPFDFEAGDFVVPNREVTDRAQVAAK